jgi:hypothetical protein
VTVSDTAPSNRPVGAACQSADAACCRQGKIFLPEGQYRAIVRYLTVHLADAGAVAEFTGRCERHDGFWLYDQRDRCQFLAADSTCGLFGTGVRPLECLWWPLHVYPGPDGRLGVNAATWCCTAGAAAAGGGMHADLVEDSAGETGHALIRAFRQVYPGRPGPLLRVLED